MACGCEFVICCAWPFLHRGHANLFLLPACACSFGLSLECIGGCGGRLLLQTRLPGAPSGASSDMLGNILNSSWAWMLFLSSEQGFSLPEVIDGCLAAAPPCNVLERTTPVLSCSKQVPVLLAAMIINLRLVTLNVFTVQENYKGHCRCGPFPSRPRRFYSTAMFSRWLPYCRRSGGTIASGDCFF